MTEEDIRNIGPYIKYLAKVVADALSNPSIIGANELITRRGYSLPRITARIDLSSVERLSGSKKGGTSTKPEAGALGEDDEEFLRRLGINSDE